MTEPKDLAGASDAAMAHRLDNTTPMPATLGSLAEQAFARMERRRAGIERPLPLPWPDVEAQFGGGLWPGLHVLVGGTGTGKTQWALQVALAAVKRGAPALYIGLELDALDIVARVAGLQASVPWSALIRGEVDPDRARAAFAGSSWPELLHAEFGRSHGWGYDRLEPLVRLVRAKHPEPNGQGSAPLLVVLDFLQVVGDAEADPRSRQELRERITRATYAGRMVARDLGAVVLFVSSAARDKYRILAGAIEEAGLTEDGAMANPDAIVGLGKESGDIEFSADSVSVLVKGPYNDAGPRPMLLATAKGRMHPAGWTALTFDGSRYEAPTRPAVEVRREILAAHEDELADAALKAENAKKQARARAKKSNPGRSSMRGTVEEEEEDYL